MEHDKYKSGISKFLTGFRTETEIKHLTDSVFKEFFLKSLQTLAINCRNKFNDLNVFKHFFIARNVVSRNWNLTTTLINFFNFIATHISTFSGGSSCEVINALLSKELLSIFLSKIISTRKCPD